MSAFGHLLADAVDMSRVSHEGPPPYRAVSASEKTDDWPLWCVLDATGVNRLQFLDRPGAKLTDRITAERITEHLNDQAGATK